MPWSGRFFGLAGDHAERRQVDVEHRFFFLALGGVLLAQADHLAQDLGVEAIGLGFGIDFLDVAGDRRATSGKSIAKKSKIGRPPRCQLRGRKEGNSQIKTEDKQIAQNGLVICP